MSNLFTYPEELNCWVDSVGFVPLEMHEVSKSDKGERFHYWKFSKRLTKDCEPKSVEYIFDHELVIEKNIIDGARAKGDLLVLEYCRYEQ